MTVTPESNLALIQQLQDLVSSAAEPPSGPEFSYPVVDQAVSTEMWRKINRNVGNGVLAEGGNPFWLKNLSNANNTADITVSTLTGEAAAVMNGFYYVLTSSKSVSLPMPSSGNITYHICLTYDPRNESNPEGPISLQTYTGTPPNTFGRTHITLWTVTRSANQLLTDATTSRGRPFVGGIISTNNVDQFPDPGSVLFGTLAFARDEGTFWYSYVPTEETGNVEGSDVPYWAPINSPRWVNRVNNTYEWPGFDYHPGSTRIGKQVYLRGVVRLASGFSFGAGNNNGAGWWAMTLPANQRPALGQYFMAAISGPQNPGFARVHVNAAGEVRFWVSRQCSWVSFDNISFLAGD